MFVSMYTKHEVFVFPTLLQTINATTNTNVQSEHIFISDSGVATCYSNSNIALGIRQKVTVRFRRA